MVLLQKHLLKVITLFTTTVRFMNQIGQIVSSDEGQHAIYQLLRGLNITNRLAGRTKDLWEDIKYEAYTNHINVADNQIAVQNGTITVNLKTGECSFQEVLNFSLHRLNCNFDPKPKVKRWPIS